MSILFLMLKNIRNIRKSMHKTSKVLIKSLIIPRHYHLKVSLTFETIY